jgi:hypothetical protein
MRSEFNSKRRSVSVGVALALLGIPTITITGCGGSSPTNPGLTPPPSSGDIQGSISANHGHSVRISAAQLQAGGALTLLFTEGFDPWNHTHFIGLTLNEVAQIRNGQRVSMTSSSSEAHTHNVTFN